VIATEKIKASLCFCLRLTTHFRRNAHYIYADVVLTLIWPPVLVGWIILVRDLVNCERNRFKEGLGVEGNPPC
jgi:hypothetical protein